MQYVSVYTGQIHLKQNQWQAVVKNVASEVTPPVFKPYFCHSWQCALCELLT